VQPLAKEAGVSLGQGFNVKKLLLDREWVKTGGNGFRLTAPAKLLAEWEENYDYRRSAIRECYTLRPIVSVVEAVRNYMAYRVSSPVR
jgi:hypothetical protein